MAEVYAVEVSYGSYDDYTDYLVGTYTDRAVAEDVAAAYQTAFNALSKEPQGDPENLIRVERGADARVYPITVDEPVANPVCLYLAFGPGVPSFAKRWKGVLPVLFDPNTGQEILNSLYPQDAPFDESVKEAVGNPGSVVEYPGKSHHITRVEGRHTTVETDTTMLMSTSREAVEKEISSN